MDLSRSIFTGRAGTFRAGGSGTGTAGSDLSADLSSDPSGRFLRRRGSRVRTSRRQSRRLRRADRRAERHAARSASRVRARSVSEFTPSPDLTDTAEWRFDDLSTSADAPDTIDLCDRPKLIQHPRTIPAPRISDVAALPPAPAPAPAPGPAQAPSPDPHPGLEPDDAAHQPVDRDGQPKHPAPATQPTPPARPARGHGLADPQLAEPTLAAVLAGVASLAAWATLAPTSIWLPLSALPAAGLMALLVPGQDRARLVRAILLLGAAAVLPAISSAMTPVTLLIALAAAAMYPLLTQPASARTVTALAVAALLTPLIVEAFRAGPQAFIDSLIDPASRTQTAVRIALTSGIVVVGLVGTSAMATRRMLTAERTAGTTEGTAELTAQRESAPASHHERTDHADHADHADLTGGTPADGSGSLEIELRDAIRSGAIEACYQPVLALGRGSQDDRIVGAEALPYWVSADGTDVPATQFMALADELGLGNQLGLHLIELALDAQLEWRHEGVGVDQVWVNVSPGQLRDPNLAHEISARLAVRGLSPACLVLEVSAAQLTETELAISSLSMLRSLGVAIALDDFGCSGTSLTSLRSLPISAVKLDHQLTGELGGHDVVAASIAQLCQTLGLRVVANGVETMRQLHGARMIGADAVQGHAIARAMSAQDITNLLSLRLPREFRLNQW